MTSRDRQSPRNLTSLVATAAALVLVVHQAAAQPEAAPVAADSGWLVPLLMVLFAIGVLHSIVTYARARATLRQEVDRPKPSLGAIVALAASLGRDVPFFVILVPARDESAVIANTINRLIQLDYPRGRYAIVIICDERERSQGAAFTTQEIAVSMASRINAALPEPLLYVLEVPEWFSGRFGDPSRTFARSTKGRALNYALGATRDHPRLGPAEMLGVLDADGRLHPQVLCEVAQHRLIRGSRLLQGPVLQISNLADVGLVGKAACVELSIYHLSTLARRLQSGRNLPRFLAGTNYFVDLQLMVEAGGWDERALVEDAELGLRLFLRSRVRAEWLSCQEIEQTPPTLKAYLRQRERWALGHFELLAMIHDAALPWRARLHLRTLILGGVFKSLVDAGLPVLGWVALAAGWTAGVPPALAWLMLALLIGSAFVWDFFGRGLGLLNPYMPQPLRRSRLRLTRIGFILIMLGLMAMQAWPRLKGLAKYATGRHSGEWKKTPRTVELLEPPVELPMSAGPPPVLLPAPEPQR